MKKTLYSNRYTILLCMGVVLWILVQLSFLTAFPFIHSDEAWLGGLSRNMLEQGDMGVTETFFDAKPRYPHAIKSIFHLLQIGFIKLLGYNVFSLRLLSLVGGGVCLLLFGHLARCITGHDGTALLLTAVLAVDIQFIYASHFARQEILLCLCICACLVILLHRVNTTRQAALLAVITGLAIGLHPNSFIIGCMCGLCLLMQCVDDRGRGLRLLVVYVGITACFAAVFVAVSYSFDPQFITHYLAYGQGEFELLVPLGEKAAGLGGFISRLFAGESGTYYLPDIRPQLLLFPIAALCCLAFALAMHREQPDTTRRLFTLLCAGAGIIAGMVIIGRYNQTSILFLFPLGWLLTAFACKMFGEYAEKILLCGLLSAVFMLSAYNIKPWLGLPSYQSYLEQLSQGVPADARVLGNLNTDFYFDIDSLRDYRNLPFALAEGSLEEYIEANEIEYILYSDELSYLYEHRPYYNVIYGNIMFSDELLRFCKQHCAEVASFQNTAYGTRVIVLVGDEKYGRVTVYRLNS